MKTNITNEIIFDDEKKLHEQSSEFQQWYNEKIQSQITDRTIPDSLDEFDRPISFTLKADGITVKVYWIYIYQSPSSWACSEFKLEIL